ncbi:hypothetical protein CHARACLAT_001703 [Characodon lateralis]|uniref:Uncharacterized protein n=1 Tax=Characodon lateralis TaxID=208331 RepID=A0ABU7EG88_9TELE|nr:hypothetical protein [Characodon lateralis]
MDGRGWGRGDLAKGPRCQVVPPAGKNCDFTRMFHRKSREPDTGKRARSSTLLNLHHPPRVVQTCSIQPSDSRSVCSLSSVIPTSAQPSLD